MLKSYILTLLTCVCVALGAQGRGTAVLVRTLETQILEKPDSIPESVPASSSVTFDEDDEPIVYETTSETDSIVGSTYNLDEIVVQADKEVRLKDGMAYYPGEELKKNSYDGINLLSRMIIPTLRVTPFSNTVTSMTGGEVSYFVNGMASTKEEVSAIDPQFVKRIDVLQNPTEAKYRGAETVINYVVTRYLWGGFTQASVAGGVPCLFANGNIQSGFTYKKMTYNVYVTSGNNKYYGSSESLQQLNINGEPYSINSFDKLTKGHNTSQKGYVSALYESANIKFKNLISLDHSLSPHTVGQGEVDYFRGNIPMLTASSLVSRHSNKLSPAWKTSLTVLFPSDIALYVDGGIRLRSNNSSTLKNQSENDVTIWNTSYDVRETGSDSNLGISFNKTWNSAHRFSITADGAYNFYRLVYHGSVETISRVTEWKANLAAAYTFMWKRGQLNTSLFGSYRKSGFGKEIKGTQRFTPSGYVNLLINPGRDQQITARVGYYPGTYPLSQIDPTLIQTSPFLWTRGNPSIKSVSSMKTDFGYKWWNSNVSIYAAISNDVTFNNIYQTAEPTEGGDGLILSYGQGTDWITTSFALSASWFISRELSITAGGQTTNFRKTNPVNENKFRVKGNFQIQWFHKNYGLYAMLSSPNYNHGFDGYARESMSYGIGGGIFLGKWKLTWSLTNPFYSKKTQEKWNKVSGGLYKTSEKQYSLRNSTRFVLEAVYTIRYGKRDMRQELEKMSGDSSLMQ